MTRLTIRIGLSRDGIARFWYLPGDIHFYFTAVNNLLNPSELDSIQGSKSHRLGARTDLSTLRPIETETTVETTTISKKLT
jgi:hypothetical protein